MAGIREHRDDMSAGLIGAFALHAVVAATLVFLAPRGSEDRVVVNSVPVTIIADAVPTAPEIAPGPPAEAPPEPLEVVAPPEPAPPPPPVAKPQPKPPQPKPIRTPKPPPTPARQDTLDLEALANDPNFKARKRSTSPTPPKPATPTQRPGGAQVRGELSPAGRADAMAAIVEQVIPNWNLNCNAPDLETVKPVIRFRLNADGRIVGEPQLMGVANASSRLAVQAMKASDPFRNVPEELIGQTLQLRFDAAKACRGR